MKSLLDMFTGNAPTVQYKRDRDEQLITCRICYDEDKCENTVSPCNCAGSHAKVHASCLEHWLSVSNSKNCDVCGYPFQTVERTLTISEWLQKKRDWQLFFKKATIVFVFFFVWCALLVTCAIKTYDYFTDVGNSYWSGTIMFVITFSMTTIMWFWLILCIVLWKRMNMVIALDQKHLNRNMKLHFEAATVV
ncbi:E3 ubiquitin-protein ligase MARCHF3-like isoform X4 [Adelges cooleyi]|nr:E3 ubiquitin-protein ligase MARCHF3-like isoform X4 [Adelges cooleyi]XP_050427035.1 E3 ubiquitin-protein ligase MARCHF3-like isoform X4 [Adelges cooleyi]XP_050427036.1 E3 ubiquitin-protein ligase MARCHF3-like isoform X4 [Adelges cooleyi]